MIPIYEIKFNDSNDVILLEKDAFDNDICVNCPYTTVELFREHFDIHHMIEEYLYVLYLNIKGKPLGIFQLSHGTMDMSVVGSKEIFLRAILLMANSIIMIHNHPSGNILPSREDDEVTKKIKQAGELLDIKLRDHIIIGRDSYYSYCEKCRI